MDDEITGAETHSGSGNKDYPGKAVPGARNKEGAKPSSCAIDVGHGGADADDEIDGERLCRVCHLGSDDSRCELIHLGCGCKNELGVAHKRCAEAWFMIKGSKKCEICGLDAKNVSGVGDRNFILNWNGGRVLPGAASARRWRHQRFCTVVMVVVVICLVVLWFFHVNR